MSIPIDSLEVTLKAVDKNLDKSVNNVISNVEKLSNTLNKIKVGNLNTLATSSSNLAKSMNAFGYKSTEKAIQNIPKMAVALNDLMKTLSKAPKVRSDVLTMVNSLSSLASSGAKVGTATKSVQRNLNNYSTSVNRAKSSTTSLAAAFGKFYASYFMVIRATKGLWDSIKSTADYIETTNYFNVALTKVGNEWAHQYEQYGYENAEVYSKSFTNRLSTELSKLSGIGYNEELGRITTNSGANLGLNLTEITQFSSAIASITNSVGQTGETSLAMSKTLTKLAGDMSSLFNQDYSSVARNLQSGIIGQSRALYKYGIDITQATLQQRAYTEGIQENVSEMSQAEKMQLRYLEILEQSKVSWGDLANTIHQPANQLRVFKNNLSETGIVLGQLFIGTLGKALPYINAFTVAIKNLLIDFASFAGIKIDISNTGLGNDMLEDFEGLEEGIDGATDSLKEWKNQLLGFDEVYKLTGQDIGIGDINALSSNLDLTQRIIEATEEYEKAWNKAYNNIQYNAEQLAQKFEIILNPLRSFGKNLFSGNFYGAGQDVGQLAVNLGNLLTMAVESLDGVKIGHAIAEFLRGLVIKVPEIVVAAIELFGAVLDTALDIWGTSFQDAPFHTMLVTALVLTKFRGIGKTLGNTILGDSASGTGLLGALKGSGGKIAAVIGTFVAGYNVGNGIYSSTTGDTFATEMGMFGQFKYLVNSSFEEIGFAWNMMWEDIISVSSSGIARIDNKFVELGFDMQGRLAALSKETGSLLVSDAEKWLTDMGITIRNGDIVETLRHLAETSEKEMATIFNRLAWKISNTVQLSKAEIDTLTNNITNQFKAINDEFDRLQQKVLGQDSFFNKVPNINVSSNNGKTQFPYQPQLGGMTSVIKPYASGGFPNVNEPFVVGEAGAELMGGMYGRPAVANNSSITDGIRQAAYEGMTMALAENNRGGGETVVISPDAEGIFKLVRRKANDYVASTGQMPFLV